MSTALTKSNLNKLTRQVQSARAMARRHKERVEGVVEGAVTTLEATAVGVGLGALYAKGRTEMFGMDAALVGAVGLHATALLMGGSSAPHLVAAGNAAAAIYGFRLGQEAFGPEGGGVVSALKRAAGVQGGDDDTVEGQGLDDEELRSL